MEGINIYDSNYLVSLIDKFDITVLIFADKEIKTEKRNFVIDTCLSFNIDILTIPDVQNWINGELSFNQIKQIKIEDLLERDPITLNFDAINKDIKDKVVMVTGAAGSIGSEIVRQITSFLPKKIILFDQAESPLYDLDLELKEKRIFIISK